MTDARPCPRCGAPLPATGECPRCLLRLGLDLPPRDPGGAPGAQSVPPPPPAARPPPPSLEDIARRFPHLEVKALIGQGGMGVVYRARQPRLDREVALKVLPPELSRDPAFAERFLREARAMARLAHPHIVAVHDFGETDGMCWLMMELVDGVNLRQALKSGALPPAKALAVVPQMCDALQYAHDEGVVHRDIKPENVLLDRAGRVKIADFGLAKLVGPQDVTLTSETQVFGTPHYMAPEQMEGARDVDHRADIFSLGVVFYEMLTGRLPVGRFELPSRRVQVDVRLDDVVLHALEHEPARRYQHAAEVKTDIESVAAGREPGVAHAGNAEAARGEPGRRTFGISVAAGRAPDGADAGRPEGEAGEMGPRPKGFKGMWLQWPGRKGDKPKPRAPEPAGILSPRSFLRGAASVWVVFSMCVWAVVVWCLAAEFGSEGREGVLVGLALLVASAWCYAQIGVHATPALRDALAAQSAFRRTVRRLIAWPALVAGLFLLGAGEVSSWEHGTVHYVSDAREPSLLFLPTQRAPPALEWLQPEPDLRVDARGGLRRAPGSGPEMYEHGHDPDEGRVFGLLLLIVFGAAVAAGARSGAPVSAVIGAVLVVPLFFFGGLRAATAMADSEHEAEDAPPRVALVGTESFAVGIDDVESALRQALELDGYAQHARANVVSSPSGNDVATVDLGFEPEAPWDRWDLEGGIARRRRPHVTLHLVGDEGRCDVQWDLGQVSPVAEEPAEWKDWVQRIFESARRFMPPAAGG